MDLEEIRKQRNELQSNIKKLCDQFTETTGICIKYVEVEPNWDYIPARKYIVKIELESI